ncbi:MAG: hypothetical protein V2I33_11435, partial [Kangiellaceae bacterium]|nr:hypothetical protein [Kangiellaceae bacterium]
MIRIAIVVLFSSIWLSASSNENIQAPRQLATTYDINQWFATSGKTLIDLSFDGYSIAWYFHRQENHDKHSIVIEQLNEASRHRIELLDDDQFIDSQFVNQQWLVFLIKRDMAYQLYGYNTEQKSTHFLATSSQSLNLVKYNLSRYAVDTRGKQQGFWYWSDSSINYFDFNRRQIVKKLATPTAAKVIYAGYNGRICLAIDSTATVLHFNKQVWTQLFDSEQVTRVAFNDA